MEILKKIQKDDSGAVAILSLLGVMVVVLSVAAVTSHLAVSELKMMRSGGVIDQTYYAAESGLNEAIYRLKSSPVPGDYSLEIGGVPVAVSVATDPTDPYRRIITTTADNANGNRRAVRLSVLTNAWAGGFDYALQGGGGGVFIANQSEVHGDVYSNAGINGANPSHNNDIYGNVFISYFNESGTANQARYVRVHGDLHARSISESEVGGHAFYSSSISSTKVGGANCPNPNCYAGSPDPGLKPLPLSASDIDGWKIDIETHGGAALTPSLGSCPSGFYCVTSNTTLGTRKIEGGLMVDIGVTLTLNGNLWVTGDVILNNNGNIQIDPVMGDASAVVISDGVIEVSNNFSISGSGQPTSFILMVSMSSSEDPPAIYASNNSDSIVFAALNGLLRVKNNGEINAGAAHKLQLDQKAIVTFNPLLSAFVIQSGGDIEVDPVENTWQEL